MNKRHCLLVLAPLFLLGACEENEPTDTTRTTGATTSVTPSTPAPPPAATTPTPGSDNTALNACDRAGSGTVTPMDQGNALADLETTKRLRREIMSDDSLSEDGHNVEIITSDGVITLRGPVKTAAERARIDLKVHKLAGAHRVVDELEVEAK
jgi:hypothetical protein